MTGKLAFLIAFATLPPSFAASCFAATPASLSDVEMDQITAGQTGAPPLILADSFAPLPGAANVASPQLASGFLGGLITIAPLFFLLSPVPATQTGSINSNSSGNGMSSSVSSSGSRS